MHAARMVTSKLDAMCKSYFRPSHGCMPRRCSNDEEHEGVLRRGLRAKRRKEGKREGVVWVGGVEDIQNLKGTYGSLERHTISGLERDLWKSEERPTGEEEERRKEGRGGSGGGVLKISK